MRTRQYLSASMKVSSGIELPEWEAFQQSYMFEEPDVTIYSDVVQKLPFSSPKQIEEVSNDEYSLYVPEIGHYLVSGGTRIVVTHLRDVEQHKLRLFLLGSAWGALCYQRGLLAIHAGSVQINDTAILLCAPQGFGKSTTTAWLAARGHALISDDLCCVDGLDQGQPVVHPSTQRFRLWGDALDGLGWRNDTLQQDFFRIDKYLVPWSGQQLTQATPLRAIYLLEWGELKLTHLTGTKALHRFISAATYRGALLQRMGASGMYWQRCLNLLKRVPVYELTRPNDLAAMDMMADMVEEHLHDSLKLQ